VLDAVDRLLSAGATEDSLSMRAVAKEVGVSPPALYLHFADKQELLYAVCERHFHGLEAAMREETAGVDGPARGHPGVRPRLRPVRPGAPRGVPDDVRQRR
jgi:AcrR family transcriptional regulator